MSRKERRKEMKDAVAMAHIHTAVELKRIQRVAKLAYKLRKVVDEYTNE